MMLIVMSNKKIKHIFKCKQKSWRELRKWKKLSFFIYLCTCGEFHPIPIPIPIHLQQQSFHRGLIEWYWSGIYDIGEKQQRIKSVMSRWWCLLFRSSYRSSQKHTSPSLHSFIQSSKQMWYNSFQYASMLVSTNSYSQHSSSEYQRIRRPSLTWSINYILLCSIQSNNNNESNNNEIQDDSKKDEDDDVMTLKLIFGELMMMMNNNFFRTRGVE